MSTRLRKHVSYANVTATLALFVALGGTSYAATQLASNSVGSAQIRRSAVGPSELRAKAVSSRAIRDRTIQTRDLATKTRTALKGNTGATGATGATGPAGPTGERSLQLRALLDANGLAIAGNGREALGPSLAPAGTRRVTFDRDLPGCVATASLAVAPGTRVPDPGAGRIKTQMMSNYVEVTTYDANGTPTDLPFSILVGC